MIEIKWLGRGGQGSFTAAKLLGLSASLYEGKYALAFPSFGPERRGAPVLAFTKIDNNKITDRSEIQTCDYAVVLDETLMNQEIYGTVKSGGTLIINTNHPEKYGNPNQIDIVTLDATSLALDILGRPVTNTAMLGALISVSHIISLEAASKGIHMMLPQNIVDKNVKLLEKAYEIVKGRRI
jgi:pyruvate ferredoxin oxidoreductase, gamma subunit (EC 1.2.7.1)